MPTPDPASEVAFHAPTDEKSVEWVLALAAAGFDYRLSDDNAGWVIHVPQLVATAAWEEIQAFELANRNWPPRPAPEPPPSPATPSSWSPLWVAGMLIAFYAWLGPYHAANATLRAGAMDPEKIRVGEWWRLFTSLTIHADAGHLVANLCGLILLGHAACRLLGSGIAWGLILLAAVLAHALESRIFPHGPISVGASTATFAALGLLAAHRTVELGRRWRFARPLAVRIALPVGAGIALLAILGTAPRSDFAAHALGLFCGALAGASAAALQAPPGASREPARPAWFQHAIELATLALLMSAWRAALVTAS